MDRARRTSTTAMNRQRSYAASASSQSTPEAHPDHHSPRSPILSNVAVSPQSAPQRRSVSKNVQTSSFMNSPPEPAPRHITLKRRAKTMDDDGVPYGGDEKDSPRKGGHTLRKRARVDYTLENIRDDDLMVPNSTSTPRTKKRRSDYGHESELHTAAPAHLRRASLDGDSMSSRRRQTPRKASVKRTYEVDHEDEDEDNDVKDTIEVGISFSDDDESSGLARTNNSTSGFALHSNPPSESKSTPSPPNGSQPTSTIEGLTRTLIDGEIADRATVGTVPYIPDKSSADASEQLRGEASEANYESVQVPDVTTNLEDRSGLHQEILGTPLQHSRGNEDERDEINLSTSADNINLVSDTEKEVDALYAKEDQSHSQREMSADFRTKPTSPEIQTTTAVDKPMSPKSSFPTAEKTIQGSNQVPLLESYGYVAADTSVLPQIMLPDIALDPRGQSEAVKNETTIAQQSIEQSSYQNEQSVTDSVSRVSVKPGSARQSMAPSSYFHKPQPTPTGRWAHLTPYVEGEYVTYPEKKETTPDDEAAVDDPAPDEKEGDKDVDKDVDKDSNDMEPMVEDNDDAPEVLAAEAPTPVLNTPTRGSPAPDSMEMTASNSPAPGMFDGDEGDVSDSQDFPDRKAYYRYRKLRDPEEYISAIENYENMTTAELFEILDAINVSLVQWQTEWTGLGKTVDDYENSLRRRLADSKYESRTRNLQQHGVNYEEPEFVVKGYKAKEKELMSETRYLQSQDRIMAAAYGFEYDPHPSKIGRQNPEGQQVGIMTRGRSLRNQPRQTAKATEADEVTGKRQRKPVLLFDPAAQDVSRSSTPVPGRGRRRKGAYNDEEVATASFNGDAVSDMDEPPSRTRHKRGTRPKTSAPDFAEEFAAAAQDSAAAEDVGRSGRRGRGRAGNKYDDSYAYHFVDEESQREPKKRHLLTLKIPRGRNMSEPSSAITDNGDSRPSTSSSDDTTHTAESSYSFRPKRQKRFRDEIEGVEEGGQEPPKKRGKRSSDEGSLPQGYTVQDSPQNPGIRKPQKIKVVRAAPPSRVGTPSSVGIPEGEEARKDYKLMTKSEKMSASMKSRWANGNMAGAVEKRKATLAAKKAAQAAAELKLGVIAPKPNNTFKVKPRKDSLTGQDPHHYQHGGPPPMGSFHFPPQ